jgi:hypothetical protein
MTSLPNQKVPNVVPSSSEKCRIQHYTNYTLNLRVAVLSRKLAATCPDSPSFVELVGIMARGDPGSPQTASLCASPRLG